jgi:hypothetical protein
MAFPVIQSTSNGATADSTSHTVTMPSGLTAGDLIVVVWCNDGSVTVSSTGFSKPVELNNSAAVSGAILWKVASGSEGASVTFTTSASEPGAYVAYRISGHNGEVEATINGDDGAGDDLTTTWALDPLTPSWGAADTLWLSSLHSQGHTSSASDTVSSGYTNQIQTTRSTSAAFAMVDSGRKENNTATESPAACTTPVDTRAVATLVGIRPSVVTTNIKTINGLAYASVKTVNGLAIASVKTVNGLV